MISRSPLTASPLQLSVDLLSPLPVQVDGEAWAQPTGTMLVTKLPDHATLLQSSTKPTGAYNRQTSKKEIALLQSVSNSEILFRSEGLSSRRQISSDSLLTTPEKSIVEDPLEGSPEANEEQ